MALESVSDLVQVRSDLRSSLPLLLCRLKITLNVFDVGYSWYVHWMTE